MSTLSLPVVFTARRALIRAYQMRDAVLTRIETPTKVVPLRRPREDGWLDGVERVLTPFRYHDRRRPALVQPVECVVWHYTASPWSTKTASGSDPARIRRWASGKGRESSTHFVILRDGVIIQLAPLHDRCWHVTSKYRWPGDGRGSINSRSIGIDYECVGWLKADARGVIRNGYKGVHGGSVGYDQRGRPWEPPTDAQIEAGLRLSRELGREFPILRDSNPFRFVGHVDVQPTRPDPGPLWPMDQMRAALNEPMEAAA